MGAYDLYGTYYPNTQDALNAENAQMAEIDARHTRYEMQDLQAEVCSQAQYIQSLEQRIKELEEKLKENR